MAAKFIDKDTGLPERVGHDGSAQQSPYRLRASFTVGVAEWCPFLMCQQPVPHAHPACWACEAISYGNLFCPACRAFWEPSESVLALRLKERRN